MIVVEEMGHKALAAKLDDPEAFLEEEQAEQVHEDVLDGFVSRESALREYGVVISDDLETLDHEATRALRASHRGRCPRRPRR